MPDVAGIIHRASAGAAFVCVDETVYSLEAIFKTCYLFTDRCYLFLRRAPDRSIEVHITPKDGAVSVEAMVGDFCNELIDQRVRAAISRESGKIREIIVAQAFAEGGLLDALDTTRGQDDYNIDPLGIGDSGDHKSS